MVRLRVTVNFSSLPTFASYRELQPKVTAPFAVSNLGWRRASLRVISSDCIEERVTTRILDPFNLISVPVNNASFQVAFHADVSYYPRMLIGVWVGPDNADGWGFVEAFIDEII